MSEKIKSQEEVEAGLNKKESITMPEVAHRMAFTFYENSPAIRLDGIPPNMNEALELAFHATKSIMLLFAEKAKAGQLDENNTIIESKIITPSNDIVAPDGSKIMS